jgi:hypothetical protein
MSRQTRITAGTPQPTFKMTGTDASQGLTAAELVHPGDSNRSPVGAVITVEDNSLRFTVGGVDASLTLGHLREPKNVIYLECLQAIKTFEFINAVAGQDAVIMVTVGF